MTRPSQIWIHTNATKGKIQKFTYFVIYKTISELCLIDMHCHRCTEAWKEKTWVSNGAWGPPCIFVPEKYIFFYHIIRRNGSIFVIEVFLCFAFFWAPTKEFKTLILVYMLFFSIFCSLNSFCWISFKINFDTVSPIAQMADIGFKVVLLERLNQNWKQNHPH